MLRILIFTIAAVTIGYVAPLFAQQSKTSPDPMSPSIHGPAFPSVAPGAAFPKAGPIMPHPGGGAQGTQSRGLAARPSLSITGAPGEAALSGALPPPAFTQMNLGGGGNQSGIDIPPTGVRFVRTDCCGVYIFGADNVYHKLNTAVTMPAANCGYFPANTSINQVFVGCGSGMEIRGCPSSASCAYFYGEGWLFYSGNISNSNTSSIRWCNTGFTRTADTANGVIGRQDPGQFMAIDPVNTDHVIVGTPTTGLFETFNGTSEWNGEACNGPAPTWTAISTSLIPLSVRAGGAYPGYAIVFDPTASGGTRTCHTGSGTCSAKAYIYSLGNGTSTAGVYATTDAGTTWTLTSLGPSTVKHIKVANADVGAGNVWVVDDGANAWELRGATWTQLTTNHAISDVTINTHNGDQVAGMAGAGIYVSTNGSARTPVFTLEPLTTLNGGDSPWQATLFLSRPGVNSQGIEFDPLNNGTLVASATQGLWTTTFPSTSFSWTAQVAGIQSLINSAIAVAAAQIVSVGAQDEAGCQYTIAGAATSRSSCFPQNQFGVGSLNLPFTSWLSKVPSQNFMVAKTTKFDFDSGDISGFSTDGFYTNFAPFNTFSVSLTATSSNLTNNGGGTIRVTTSTTGLNSFSPGQTLSSNSIICLSSNNFNIGGVAGSCYPITVVDATHFDLLGSSFNSSQQSGNYTFYVPAQPLSAWWGLMTVTNVTNDRGLVKVSVVSPQILSQQGVVCISGVTTNASTTTVNGCWVPISASGGTFDLAGSTFVGGDSYKTGGVAMTFNEPGGGIAASTTKNWVVAGGDRGFPKCTTNAGATWSEVDNSAVLVPAAVLSAASAGASTLTLSTSIGSPFQATLLLHSGRYFTILGGSYRGTTITLPVPIPPGDSVDSGAPIYTTNGWPFAAYLGGSIIAADQVTPNTFYAMNNVAGLLKWTNCGTTTVVSSPSRGFLSLGGFNEYLKAVPGEAGQLFFTVGNVGSTNHPAGTRIWRTCNGGNNTSNSVTWSVVPGFFEPQTFGFGGIVPGQNYPSIIVVGWYSMTDDQRTAVYGIWKSTNDPNHGVNGTCSSGNTWTNIGTWPNNDVITPTDITGDPFVTGTNQPVYYSGGGGMFYGIFN